MFWKVKKGTYKWAMKQVKEGILVSRKANGFRIHEDYIAGTLIVYKRGSVMFGEMFKSTGIDYKIRNKKIADHYCPSKEDIKAIDWVIDDSRFKNIPKGE